MPKYAADPKAPKRPQSAYFLFMGTRREAVQAELGTKSLGVVGKAIGEEWGKLSDAQKKPFADKAAKAKAVYDKKNASYRATAGYSTWLEGKKVWQADQKKNNKKKELKAMLANQPKRPLSAYMLYSAAVRSQHSKPGVGVAEVGKAIGAAWKSESASTKAKYTSQYAKAKAAYDKKMAKYKQGAEYQAYEQAVAENKEQEKAAKKRAKKRAAKAARA